jgi:Mg-chelatase subunit ChlD/flagellar biosynthesis regulator FlaF
MKNRRISLVVLILAIFILTTSSYSAVPAAPVKDNPSQTTPAATSQPEEKGADIVLLIDSSGSMKKTDPRDYRKDAARLFISLLGAEDSVGVVSFGDSARQLIPLTPNSPKNRPLLFGATKKISSKEYSTDITGALKKGVDELESSEKKNRALILMSDGKLALGDPKKDEDSNAELIRMLPEIRKAGIKVYSIAFSELSDPKLLGDISEKTGGLFRYAKTDRDIHIMFAAIFEKIKSPDSVALKGDTFEIDTDIREAVLLITKRPGTLTGLFDPSGKKNLQKKFAKNIRWYSSDVFDMITILEPKTGKWKVSLSSKEGNRIFVLTDLKLKSSLSGATVSRGDKIAIDAWLEREDEKIIDREVLDQVTFEAEISGPDGKPFRLPLALKPAPAAGIYAAEFTVNQPGDYSVKISAEGKTFNRMKDLNFNSIERPQTAAPVQPEVKKEASIMAYPGDIDWEMSLALALAMNLLLLLIVLILVILARRYRKLYRETLAHPSPIPVAESPAAEKESAVVQEAAPLAIELSLGDDAEPDANRIKKLIRVIEFQKGKISELMTVGDIFENVREKLGSLHEKSAMMNRNIKTLSETHNLGDEMSESVEAVDNENKVIADYVVVIEKEQNSLVEKFRKWEEDLQLLMKDEDISESSSLADLEAQLQEKVEQLKAKEENIADLTSQLESLDKEYMILYHAQKKHEQEQDKKT